ncbi:MAG TPA: flagellar hook capping FlgD N-terminal domain-containing protein [Edaphobacter sp.]|jgi:flagellar basal-body rod modification protein FlgD|nr:flagellar hook capping FlgD N-terminal domain-containing protein [Edaphobacter sp.]
MDLSQLGVLAGHGGGAATRVATALAPKSRTNVAAKDDSSSSGDSSSTTDNSTITANDFLTLLVTELKNQDPTQPTDPNAYIQQLVGVNSLQQLISMNQGLSTFETNFDNAISGSGSDASQA